MELEKSAEAVRMGTGLFGAQLWVREGRSARQAILAAKKYIQAGRTFVVDLDMEKFYDRVQHDVLMARVARMVEEKRVLRLIRRFL